MTFPSGGPGYPQQGGGPQPNPQAPGTGGFPPHQPAATLSMSNLTVLLALGVTLLGLVNYFIGFSEEAAGAEQAIMLLLVGGLLAAMRALPRGPRTLPFAALLSLAGALEGLLAVVHVPTGGEVPGVVTVILILGILQAIVAVVTVLFDHGILKLPAGQGHAPYGQPYPQPGQFGQPQQGPEKQGPQGTQFTPPAPQSTVYAPQQGQFYQPQQPESGSQHPGTPPGGFGNQG